MSRLKVAIVGGDGRHEHQQTWPEEFDVRCYDNDNFRRSVNSSVDVIVCAARFMDKGAFDFVRRNANCPVKVWTGGFGSLAKGIDELLENVTPAQVEVANPKPLTQRPLAALAEFPKLVHEVAPARVSQPPTATPTPPPTVTTTPAREPAPTPPSPPPTPVATTYDPKARYAMPCFEPWDSHTTQVLLQIAESGIVDADKLCDEVAIKTGQYRTVGSLKLQMKVLRMLSDKVSIELMRSLERAAQQRVVLKKAQIEEERKLMKRGMQALPQRITAETAKELVAISNRLNPLQSLLDKTTNALTFDRDEVLAVREDALNRTGGDLNKALTSPPKNSEETVIANMMAKLKDGPLLRSQFEKSVGTTRERLMEILARLIREKKLIKIEHPLRKDSYYYALPGDEAKVPKPATKPSPKPTTVPPIVAPAAAQPTAIAPATAIDSSLTTDIYRAIKAGELTPQQGAEMLKVLAGK